MLPQAQPGLSHAAAPQGLSVLEISSLVKELKDRFQANQGGNACSDARIQPWRHLSAIPALMSLGIGGAGSGGVVQAPALQLPADANGFLGGMVDVPLNLLGDGYAMSRPIEISSALSGSTSTSSRGPSSSKGDCSTPSNRSSSSSASSSSHEDTDEEVRAPANFSLDFILNPRDPSDCERSRSSINLRGKPEGQQSAAGGAGAIAAHHKSAAATDQAPAGAGAASASPSRKNSNVVPRYWSEEEHLRFLEGIRVHGPNNHMAIAMVVGTRTAVQVRSHGQKFFNKLGRHTGSGLPSMMRSGNKIRKPEGGTAGKLT